MHYFISLNSYYINEIKVKSNSEKHQKGTKGGLLQTAEDRTSSLPIKISAADIAITRMELGSY